MNSLIKFFDPMCYRSRNFESCAITSGPGSPDLEGCVNIGHVIDGTCDTYFREDCEFTGDVFLQVRLGGGGFFPSNKGFWNLWIIVLISQIWVMATGNE